MPMTPGPWEHGYTKEHSAYGNVVVSPVNRLVAAEMTEDDARAIAALPLLIAALQDIVSANDAYDAAFWRKYDLESACDRCEKARCYAIAALAAAGVEP